MPTLASMKNAGGRLCHIKCTRCQAHCFDFILIKWDFKRETQMKNKMETIQQADRLGSKLEEGRQEVLLNGKKQ